MAQTPSRLLEPTDASLAGELQAVIQEVPDFPSAGILFKDVTPIFLDAPLFRRALRSMAAPFADAGLTHVAAIESRGFILGAPLALDLGLPLVPIRKQGKLPRAVERVSYALEYGSGVLEMHRGVVGAGSRVLVVDDVLATGGTAAAAADLIVAAGGAVAGFSFLVTLSFLPGVERLAGRPAATVVTY